MVYMPPDPPKPKKKTPLKFKPPDPDPVAEDWKETLDRSFDEISKKYAVGVPQAEKYGSVDAPKFGTMIEYLDADNLSWERSGSRFPGGDGSSGPVFPLYSDRRGSPLLTWFLIVVAIALLLAVAIF